MMARAGELSGNVKGVEAEEKKIGHKIRVRGMSEVFYE